MNNGIRENTGKWNEQDVEQGRFEAIRGVVAALRAENGCPWDRAQTFESLKPCMINEMTEAIAAIDIYEETQSAENLCEELGDVLLQVVLQAQIAEEEGLFSVEDVIRGISRKMIRRHPHVFPGKKAETAEAAGDTASDPQPVTESEVPGRWEAIKQAEKNNRTPEMEKREKEAFAAASVQVIRHLQEKEQQRQKELHR